MDDENPYLCNNCFCIKTEKYNEIIYDKNLFVDKFDEVPLSRYTILHQMKHVYIKNGLGIHMYYNWHQDFLNLEKQFCNRFFV